MTVEDDIKIHEFVYGAGAKPPAMWYTLDNKQAMDAAIKIVDDGKVGALSVVYLGDLWRAYFSTPYATAVSKSRAEAICGAILKLMEVNY